MVEENTRMTRAGCGQELNWKVAWLTGITAVVVLLSLSEGATVGTGLGVIGVSGMVAIISYLLLRN